MSKTVYFSMLVCISIMGECYLITSAFAGDPVINVTPFTPTTVTTFDPKNPPPDLKPGEDGQTKFIVDVTSDGSNLVSKDGTNYTVTGVDPVNVSGSIDIELPNDATDQLRGHESGHDRLARFDYNKTASDKATAAMRSYVGMTFKGVGNTDAERKDDATRQATEELNRRLEQAKQGISDQIQTLSDKYDTLTQHGKSSTVTTDQGEQEAKRELKLAFAPGSIPLTPGMTTGTSDPPSVTYDPVTARLSFDFSSDGLNFSSKGASDPILGAAVSASPLQVIGLQENGTIMLATSELSVVKDSSVVLHGYIIEAAYMPSNLPGFGGMIQGYLDVPPPATGGGITNSISSPFLDSYQASLNDPNSSRLSTFWFYTDQPLFDSNGLVLTTYSTGVMKFGVAQPVPEPSTFVLFGLAGGTLWFCARRQCSIAP